MDFADLDRSLAVQLEVATDGRFFRVLHAMLDVGLAPHFFVVRLDRRPHAYSVVVIAVAEPSDEIVREVALTIAWGSISERARLTVLTLYVDQIIADHGSWILRMNPRLVALGARRIGAPDPRS